MVSLYAPNRNPARDQFLELVPCWVDFKMVFDRPLDRAASVASATSRESSSTLSSLFDDVVSLTPGGTCIPPPLVTRG